MHQTSWLFAPEEILTATIDGKLIASKKDAQHSWEINPVALKILQLLEQPQTLDSLCEQIIQEFDTSKSECESATIRFIDILQQSGMCEALADHGDGDQNRQRYLDLLKRSLVNLIYPEHELRINYLIQEEFSTDKVERAKVLRDIRLLRSKDYDKLTHDKHYGLPTVYSHTLIGLRRLNNLEYCARQIFNNNIPGDFFEAGVCQGGAMIFLRALQVAFGEESRTTWGADSFQGLPIPESEQDLDYDFSEGKYPWLSISEETVRHHFSIYGLLSERVKFIPGWFEDTLPKAKTGPIALLRLDADLYKSTREILENLYDRVSPGGFIVVDDYGAFKPCKEAIDEFRAERTITEPLRWIDWSGVFWRKS